MHRYKLVTGLITLALFFLISSTSKAQEVTLLQPADSLECASKDVTFGWQSGSTPVHWYKLEISESDDFSTQDYVFDELNSTTFSVTLENNTQYYWRVSASFTDDTYDMSETRLYKTQERGPALIYPNDEQQCVSMTPEFVWEDMGSSASYTLQVAESSSFTSPEANITGISSNTFSQLQLANEYSDYYWRVRVKYSATCFSEWSEARTFLTEPPAPALLTPAHGKKGAPFDQQLDWSDLPQAESYRLQVSANQNFSPPLEVDAAGLELSEFTLSLTENNQRYWWRVSASFTECMSDWTTSRNFITGYEAPELVNPEDGEDCVPLKSNFTWENMPDGEGYRIQVSDDMNFDNIVYDEATDAPFAVVTLDQQLTDHWWRARVEDDDNIGFWSNSNTFTTSILPPVLLSPEDDAVSQPLTVTLDWEEESTGAIYNLQVATSKDFDDDLIEFETNLKSSEYELTVDEYNADYYWRVQAIYSTCTSTWSQPFHFNTVIAPPVLLTPEDGATEVPLRPFFTWEEVDGALRYQIGVAKDADFEEVVAGADGLQATAAKFIDPLEPNTKYYWKVRSKNNTGISDWSGTFTFETGAQGPEQPVLISPENRAEMIPVDPVLDWEDAERADFYRIVVSPNENFTNAVLNTTVTESSATLTDLEHFTTYYWHVAAVNDSGTVWSDVWRFRTIADEITTAVNLWTPANNTDNLNTTVNFTWYPIDNAEGYAFQLATDDSFDQASLVKDRSAVYKTEYRVIALDYEQDYWWRVRAFNEAGDGPWSQPWTFNTKEFVSVNETEDKPFESNVYPNPVNGSASMQFNIPEAGNVHIALYNSMGQEMMQIADKYMSAGTHNLNLDLSSLENGMYIYTITSGNTKEVRRIILMK